jgi:NTP pyrophosphatase (non-canonical NTP hydrolase)
VPDPVATVDELKLLVKNFCEERDWDQFHNPKDLAIGISTEAAELLEIFRFKTDQQARAMLDGGEKRNEVAEELADVFYFLLRFAQMYGFDLSEELRAKLAKNAQRYPVERSKGSNRKYDE